MAKLEWDKTGERKYETGTSKGVLFVQNGATYSNGVAWNGLTGVTESPSGAEANDMWADNIKYGSIRSAETYAATIEAYTYPDEFKICDGQNSPIYGLSFGQQSRTPFAFSWQTNVGNDTVSEEDDGYKIHIIYNATASPSEKAYSTINDSPEAITFSWEVDTTPITVEGYNPVSSIEIDTTKLTEDQKNVRCIDALENILYGTNGGWDSILPYPEEIFDIMKINRVEATYTYTGYHDEKISSITLPNTTGLKNVIITIPDEKTEISNSAGYNRLTNVSYIYFPNSITHIRDQAFYNVNKLVSLNLPTSLTYIGPNAFYCCYALTSLTIPNSVTGIGKAAFKYCSSLDSLIIPDSVTLIGDEAFSGCGHVKSLTLSKRLTKINTEAFRDCHSITSLIIPDSVTTIGYKSFEDCDSLTSLTIGDSVTGIGAYAFSGCGALTSLTIPDSVTNISDSAFMYCSTLTSLTLGNSVTDIGASAFYGCGSLTSLTIPDSVTNISRYAFKRCRTLTSLVFGNGLQRIYEYSFEGCLSLETVDLTSFDSSDESFSVPVSDANVFYNHPDNIKFYFKDQNTLDAFAAATNWSDLAGYFEVMA